MTMEIANVEPDSLADKTGQLKKGQIIESMTTGVALKMEIKTYQGVDFLLVEKDGLNFERENEAEIPPDFHPGYHVYIRKE